MKRKAIGEVSIRIRRRSRVVTAATGSAAQVMRLQKPLFFRLEMRLRWEPVTNDAVKHRALVRVESSAAAVSEIV